MTDLHDPQRITPARNSRPQDRPINPYRMATSDAARELVEEITRQVDDHQQAVKPRSRKRKEADRRTFEATVAAVVVDLLHQCLNGVQGGVSLGRSNDWPPVRYQTPVHTKMLADVLDALADDRLGYVEQRRGQRSFDGTGHLTSLLPTAKLQAIVTAAGLTPDDVGGGRGGEIVHLQGPKPLWGSAPLLDFQETEETIRLRGEMAKINDWLADANLSVDEDCLGADADFPDLSARWLIRRFTHGSFESGGRLWEGFWQAMRKDDRRSALLIDGEPAVELDFGQAGARILYGMAGVPVPDGDLYAVPGFEQHRDGIKSAMSAMTFARRRLVRMPPDLKTKFGKGHSMKLVVQAVERFHPGIAHLFFRGAGHRAQRTESDIIVATMLRLIDLRVTALPVHDALMVGRPSARVAGELMLEVFRGLAGVEGKLSSHPPDALALTSRGRR